MKNLISLILSILLLILIVTVFAWGYVSISGDFSVNYPVMLYKENESGVTNLLILHGNESLKCLFFKEQLKGRYTILMETGDGIMYRVFGNGETIGTVILCRNNESHIYLKNTYINASWYEEK